VSRRALVIGAGFAGLRAAEALASRGWRVIVLERKANPGGRAGSAPDPVTGEPVDTGQHVLLGCYRETLRWLRRLGTLDRLRFDGRLRLDYLVPGRASDRLEAARLPAPFHLVSPLLGRDGVGLRGLLRLLAGLWLPFPRGADQITVAEWMDRMRLPRRIRERFVVPLAVAALNERPERASAAPFLAALRAIARSGARGGAVGLAAVGLADLYVPQARARIERAGGEVRTGAWAARVLARDGRAAGAVLADGSVVEADAVVAAVPPWDLARLIEHIHQLDGLRRRALAFEASPILTVHLWWDAAVLPGRFAGLTDGPFEWAFNRTAAVGGTPGGEEHLALVRSGARDLLGKKPEELEALAETTCRRHLPSTPTASVVRTRVVWEPKATVSLAPGTGALRPGPRTALRGFFVAGDWTATGLPATIESAVVSGLAAARAAGRGE
jgi:squalene-associated FAD-dependent desaturase